MELSKICKTLKETRIQKKLQLQEVSKHTKLPPNILKKIEDYDNLDSLGPFYLRNFLKIYAQFLGHDNLLKEINGLFRKEKPKEPIFKFPVEKNNQAKDTPPAPTESIAQEQKVKPEPKSPEKKIKKEDAQIPLKKDPPNIKFSVKIISVIMGVVIILLLLKLPRKEKIQKEPPNKPATVEKKTETKESAPKPSVKKEIVKPIVSILTKGNVFIEVKADGKLIFQNIIIENIKESWIAKEKLEIKISNPSLVALEIGGKSIPTSNTKRPATYTITPEGFQVDK